MYSKRFFRLFWQLFNHKVEPLDPPSAPLPPVSAPEHNYVCMLI